jgi:DNA-binding MarR family transcriptional regulator
MQAGRLAMEWTTEVLADVGLALSEFAVLALVQRFGGISQRAVGDRLGLSDAAVSRIATMLEGRHLISRRQDLRSPRRRALYLTGTGVQLMADASRAVEAVDGRFRLRVDDPSILALSELPPRSLSPVELAIRALGG